MKLSKTQIDRLGARLREGPPSESDLRLLDEYRRALGESYETVIDIVRGELKLEPTGRPAKSTSAIVEKLRRESIRLSQVQDIAGCRVVVADIAEQDRVVELLRRTFLEASVSDRREKPSYGYRAVHVIARISGHLVEIQIRSSLQHLWAELSEKLADVVDSTIKYGSGPKLIQQMLANTGAAVAVLEELEKEIVQVAATHREEDRQKIVQLKQQLADTFIIKIKEFTFEENQKEQKK